MAKQYTVYDATKEELIEFCFNPREVRGVLMKQQFLAWLARKRTDELITSQEESIELSQKSLHEYIDLVKKANDEPDLDRKLAIFEKANKAYEQYEKAEKAYAKLDKQLSNSFERWN